MSALTEFLLARIAEDEETARETLRLIDWQAKGTRHRWAWSHAYKQPGTAGWSSSIHQGSPSPARVLAECEAKRQVVNHLRSALMDEARQERAIPHDEEQAFAALRARQAVECIAGHVAAVYAGHPDYDKEWEL